MALRQSDVQIHNNPNLAVVDSDFVKGGFRTAVGNVSGLYALSGKTDLPAACGQVKEYATIVYVTDENKYYILKDVDNIANANGWEIFLSGGGGGTLTGATNGIHLVNSGTSVALGGLLTQPTIFTGSTTNHLKYGGNYSLGYTERSIPDKEYVDTVALGLQIHAAVVAATTVSDGNITLSGSPKTIDGISLTNGMRVLVKNQTSGSTNGIYIVTGGTWNRSDDYNFTPSGEISNGDLIPVITGNTNRNTLWVLATQNPISSGDSLNFTLFSNPPVNYIAGQGINISGTTIKISDPTYAIITAAITSANNGLTKSGTSVRLGGSLTGNTTINTVGNSFKISGNSSNVLYVCGKEFAVGDYLDTQANFMSFNSNGLPVIIMAVSSGVTGSELSLQGNGGIISLYGVNGSVTQGLDIYSNTKCVNLYSTSGVNQTYLRLCSTAACIGGPVATFGGIKYAANYSSNFTPRSLVDKAYVTGGTYISAGNGLCNCSGTIMLGGEVDRFTEICTMGNKYLLIKSGDDLTSWVLSSAGTCTYSFKADNSCYGSVTINPSTVGMSATNNTNPSQPITANVSTTVDSVGKVTARLLAFDQTPPTYYSSFMCVYPTGMTVQGPLSIFKGIQYTQNYANNFVSRSLVDKGYVDGKFNTTVTGATNGLSTFSPIVGLGGGLTKNTCISGSSAWGLSITGLTNLNLGFSGVGTITDTSLSTPAGLVYAGNYSANFGARSLVDKGYVTGLTSNIAADNGLTNTDGVIELGGVLTKDTCINTGAFDFRLSGTSIGLLMDSVSCITQLYAKDSFASSTALNVYSCYIEACTENSGAFQGFRYANGFSTDVGDVKSCSIPDIAYVTGLTQANSNVVSICIVTTTNYTGTTTSDFIGVSGTCNVYLPQTPKYGQRISVADICGNALADNITIWGNGKCVNGSSCAVINTDYGSISFINNGFSWSAVAYVM